MPVTAQVTIYDISEKLPPAGGMILADIGGEWEILMSNGTGTGYAWEGQFSEAATEDDDGIPFFKWALLGELTNPTPVAKPNMCGE